MDRRNAETKRYENLITQEEAKKNTDMRLAAIAQQTNQTRAVADMATQRKEMEVMNEKVEREQKVEIARKEQQINVARGEIARKEQELEGSMVRDTSRFLTSFLDGFRWVSDTEPRCVPDQARRSSMLQDGPGRRGQEIRRRAEGSGRSGRD